MRGIRVSIVVLLMVAAIALVTPTVAASASWSTYFGTGTMCTACNYNTGYNYWTNNRIYRPVGYAIYLFYYTTAFHYSATNSGSNPFYFASYGYNFSGCGNNQGAPVPNATCEAYA